MNPKKGGAVRVVILAVCVSIGAAIYMLINNV